MTSPPDRGPAGDLLEVGEGPSIEAMRAFLTSDAVVRPDGAVLSWQNPAHPGYPYPEAAALLLSLLALDGEATRPLRDRIAARLGRDLSPAGGVGRGESAYLFDTAVALAALLAHRRAGGALPAPDLPARLFRFLHANIGARCAVVGPDAGAADHWSRVFGSHLLKVVIALGAYGEAGASEAALARPLIGALSRALSPLQQRGRFVTHAGSTTTYTHAHCYAVEGLIALSRHGDPGAARLAREGASWLVEAQHASGGLFAHHDGERPRGPLRADATAQAVRLWASLDRRALAGPIARALAFLRALQAPSGGLRYDTESDDVNTWATVFAVQALRFVREGESPHWI